VAVAVVASVAVEAASGIVDVVRQLDNMVVVVVVSLVQSADMVAVDIACTLAVAVVADLDHSTTLIYSSLSSMSIVRILMYFTVQRSIHKLSHFMRKKPYTSMDFPSHPCKGTIAI
jgi:hypothetical protein